MPLSKEKQKQYQRQYRLKQKSTGVLLEQVGLKIEGNKIKRIETQPLPQKQLPIYNPALHKTGDKVLMRWGSLLVETIVPTLDADGNPFEDYTPGRLLPLTWTKPARAVAMAGKPAPKTFRKKPVRPFRR